MLPVFRTRLRATTRTSSRCTMNRKHTTPFLLPIVALCLNALPLPVAAGVAPGSSEAAVFSKVPDSQQMSDALRKLPWASFRSIIEAVPKLSAGVDAYGPAGWEFVRENYKAYNWKKKIDKLDDGQKQQLAELIRKAQASPRLRGTTKP